MKKWIRWKGLIGFAVAVVLLVLFFMLFIDSIIKSSIEYTGTSVVGAKVELDKAEFRFSPLGMQLTQLQVTNPEQPMQNIVDIKNINFNLDGLNLLRRKILINEMRVEGLKLNTARKTSGAIKQAPKAKPEKKTPAKKDAGFKLPEVAIPDANKILEREEIKTVKLAEEYKANVKSSQDNWVKIRDGIPGEKQITDYKKRIADVKQTDTKDAAQLAAAIKELKSIKKGIKADINFVDASQNQIRGELDKLTTDLKVLKDSPQQEYARIRDKYSIDAAGIGNVSHLLFGSDAKHYTEMAMGWYKKIEPWLAYVDVSGQQAPKAERHKGLDIRFKEYSPKPDFLIKLVHATVELEQGSFKGKIMDVTNEQDITRKPTSLHFTGANMQGIGSILLTGNFNHINPAKAKDQLNFSMAGYQLNKYRLIHKDDMTIYLDQAKSDIQLVAKRENKNIKADFSSHIHSIKYNNKASGNELAMMFLSSINKTRDFNVYGKLRGTFDDYSTRVSSDLDNRLKANMKQHMNQRLADFRKELKNGISLKARQPVDDAEKKYKELSSSVKNDIAIRKASLTQQLNKAEEDLKQKEDKLKAQRDSQKQQVKDKAKEKLKSLFK